MDLVYGIALFQLEETASLPQLKTELRQFTRRILLADYFREQDNAEFIPKLHLPGNTWIPPRNSAFATSFTNMFSVQFNKVLSSAATHNRRFHNPLLNSIRNLRNSAELKVVQSDKNLGLVLMTIEDYNALVRDHLTDPLIYSKIDAFTWPERLLQIRDHHRRLFLRFRHSEFNRSKQALKFLDRFCTDMPNFHCLPKLHKDTRLLKGRPIVGATNWVTTPWSIWLDTIVSKVECPFHLKNSLELISSVENMIIPANSLLISADVSSLYTNMKISILERIFINIFPNHLLADVLRFICDNNFFQYGSQIFHQRDGIAMGTNCAVSLARIYLKEFDAYFSTKFVFYRRYIDDVFAIFNGPDPSLIFSEMNDFVDGITLNFCKHRSTIPFLDLNVNVSANYSIYFSLYQKPINIYQYLPPFTYHSPSILRSYIYGELLRIVRCCTLVPDRLDHFYLLFNRLLKRGYSKRFLLSIFCLVNIQDAPVPVRPRAATRIIPFVTRFARKPYVRLIQKLVYEFNLHPVCQARGYRLLTALSKQKNLLQLCSRSNLNPEQERRLADKGLLP